jgi:hypothetical protein
VARSNCLKARPAHLQRERATQAEKQFDPSVSDAKETGFDTKAAEVKSDETGTSKGCDSLVPAESVINGST